MVRNGRDTDADDFMPDRRDAAAAGKRVAKQKIPRNRGSQERLTELYNDFNEEQKAAADTMGMHTLMNLLCTNLNNNLCDWLGRTYEPESKEFVIHGRGRIPLDEDSVYNTLGVPNGGMDVPYKVDREIQDRLFPEMFPGLTSMPLHSVAATMLSEMNSSGEDFKRLLLMYLISTVFAPTTSTHLSSRCFPVLANIDNVANMNWCKFIAGFLHTALSKNIYNKGCRLHLMLTYVDNLDLSTVNLKLVGGLPAAHKFAASAWTDAAIKAVLAADTKPDGSFGKLQLMGQHSVDFSFFGGPRNFSKWMDVHTSESCSLQARTNVETLVGEFASGMTNLLGNLVQGWTAMTGRDGAEVANQFRTFVPCGTTRPIGSRGRYQYNDSQEWHDSEEEFLNEADDSDDVLGRGNDATTSDVQMENVHIDPENQHTREVDDVAAAGKPGPSTAGVGMSKRVRDSEAEVHDSAAKRPKFDPVDARRSEATAGGRASKQTTVVPPSRSSTRLNKGPPTEVVSGHERVHKATRSSPRFASSNTGDPVVLEDMRDGSKRQKKQLKKAAPVTKTKKKDPLEHIHTKLATSDNVDPAKASATGTVASSSAAPVTFLSSIAAVLSTDGGASAGGPDELISPRTVEVVPALVSMRHGVEGGANPSETSVADKNNSSDVDAATIQADTQAHATSANHPAKTTDRDHPSDEAGARVTDATVAQNKVPAVTQQTDEAAPHARTDPASAVAKTAPHVAQQKMAKTIVCTRKSPHKRTNQGGNVHDQKAKVVAPSFVSASTLFPPAPQSTTADSVQMKGRADGSIQQPPVSLVENLPANPRIDHTMKGTGKKVVINIPDTTPRPPVKPKAAGSDVNEMFVDLSPLAAAVDVIEKQNDSKGRHPLAFTPPSCSLGLDLSQSSEPVDAVPVSYAFPTAPVLMMAQPNVDGKKAVKFAEPIVQGPPDEISPSLDEAFCKMEEDALMRKKNQTQAPSSSGVADVLPSDNVHSSVTPGSVRQARVVHPPPEVDSEPQIKATKQQQALYDIMRRFANARSKSKHMNAIRETKVIQCYSTYVDLGDLAESMMPNGKLSRNVVAAGIDYINGHVDIHCDKIIMSPTITRRIWEGDYSRAEVSKAFASHGDNKLTLKKFVMFPMFQELAPNDPVDKAGHYYTICINLAKQRFDVLDSIRSGEDDSLRSHAEFFINNLKQTWLRHYSGSKVQIKDYPIEYVKCTKQGNTHDCGVYLLEYLAKWEGRKVPTLNKEIVSELRKIYMWNWVTNVDFNKRAGAKAWIEDAVKTAVKRYR